jgi:hypothetical protein
LIFLMAYAKAEVHKPCTGHSVDYVCCCAVHACTGWNGPACSWWEEGRIGNWRGRRTDPKWERQIICLLRYGDRCRFDKASSHTCTVHCTRAGVLCTSVLKKSWKTIVITHLFVLDHFEQETYQTNIYVYGIQYRFPLNTFLSA